MQTPSTREVMTPPRCTELQLPEVYMLDSCSVDSEFYGASVVAAEYCGFDRPPHTPRGCPFQAWSVGEAIRIDKKVLAAAAPGRRRREAQAV